MDKLKKYYNDSIFYQKSSVYKMWILKSYKHRKNPKILSPKIPHAGC